jgi:hypothetical protein
MGATPDDAAAEAAPPLVQAPLGHHPRRPGRAVGHRHAHQRPPADQPAGHHRSADPTGQGDHPAPTKPPATEPAESAPGIGERARDGKFEFVVSRVRCGVDRIGDQYLNKTAQGHFCLISVRVRNVGDEQRTFEQSSQYLFDTAGRRYETGDAGLYLEDSKSFLEEINPGNGVDGTLVYDVPKSFKAAKIELHDSAFSGGVEVTLSGR